MKKKGKRSSNMFSREIQQRLRKEGFDLMDSENNIWIKENSKNSITISEGLLIYQNYETDKIEEISFENNEFMNWVNKNFINE
jgi:uncharacterized protein involved in tolerance to divalent cations